jgi:phage gp29-like protein
MSTRISAQHHSLSQARHPQTKRFVKQRTNGNAKVDTASTIGTPITYGLNRILRPQAAFRWILPNLAAITPQYIEMILRGALAGNHVQQWELFDLMFDTWPELTACSQELIYGVLRKKLIFEPFHEEDEKPTPSAVERSKLVSTALRVMQPDPARDDCALDGTIKDILDGWFRGVTVSEVIWQMIDDKQLGTIAAPKSTFWVHPVCFAFNADGVLGLRETKPYSNTQWPFPSSTLSAQPQPAQLIPFPNYKFLIAIHKAKSGTALGGPLLRPLAWWWCAANFSADWLLNLAQVFGLPFRWANYDPNAPQATVDAICQMLQNMGNAGWAAFPIGTTLDMKEPSGSHGSDHSPQGELLDRADRYARMLILGQTMSGTRGQTGKGGGQAFGVVEKNVKEDRIDAAGKFAASVINDQLVNSILMLNYGDTDEAPDIRFLEEEEAGLVEAQRDQVLINAGLPIGMDFLRKKYGIPEPADGEETVNKPPAPAFGKPPGGAGGAGGQSGPDEQSVEDQMAQGKLRRILAIKDDAMFARELSKLAGEI